MDRTFSKKRKGETTGKKLQKIKVWKLQECAEYRRQVGETEESEERATKMWKASKEAMVEVVEKLCGRTSGRGAGERETWWWTEEVQKIKEKRTFKEWQDDEESLEKRNWYNVAKRQKGPWQ
ncbi:uncharacterized protein LOC134762746 [Penaeus indicus]|uniref:uncharacterized protein LOC134762746 n=1 Tax=Penaeus indicus TaxID=29960 RepID=UPI00300D7418